MTGKQIAEELARTRLEDGADLDAIDHTGKRGRIVKPKNHQFLVPESIWVEDNDPDVLSALLEGILAHEGRNMMLWFVDRREPLWRETRQYIDWGLFHKMTPQPIVDVVVMRKNPLKMDELRSKPIFVAGWDMV